MKIMKIIFIKALKNEHNYNVTNYFGDADSKYVARFIAVGKVFDIVNYALILRI